MSHPLQYQCLFKMRQVVRTRSRLDLFAGTVIGRAEHLASEPTYLVRDIESTSTTEGRVFAQSELRAA